MTSDQEVGQAVVLVDDSVVAPDKYGAIRAGANLSIEEWNDDRIQSILRYAGGNLKKVSDAAVFFGIAAAYDLNPLVGEIYAFPAQGKIRVFAGRDGFLKAAHRNPSFEGIESGVIFEGDEFKLVHRWDAETGQQMVFVESVQGFPGYDEQDKQTQRRILGAYAIVWASGRPTVVTREWEYYRYLWSQPKSKRPVWHDDPQGMIQNRCIAAALRRAVPLANLWIKGEEGDFDEQTRLEDTVGKSTRQRLDDLKAEVGLGSIPVTLPTEEEVANEVDVAESERAVMREQMDLLQAAMTQFEIPDAALAAWARFHATVPEDPKQWNIDHVTLAVMAIKEGDGKEFLREHAKGQVIDDDRLGFEEKMLAQDSLGRIDITKDELRTMIDRMDERSDS